VTRHPRTARGHGDGPGRSGYRVAGVRGRRNQRVGSIQVRLAVGGGTPTCDVEACRRSPVPRLDRHRNAGTVPPESSPAPAPARRSAVSVAAHAHSCREASVDLKARAHERTSAYVRWLGSDPPAVRHDLDRSCVEDLATRCTCDGTRAARRIFVR
jgi:hypothetical protein